MINSVSSQNNNLKKKFNLKVEETLHKKWSFPLRISSVNVTKSLISSGFGHIYWKKSLMGDFTFCEVKLAEIAVLVTCEISDNAPRFCLVLSEAYS